jgi:hypothetical protein
MPTDPMEEWRRLTTLYGEMGDLEIRELAEQIGDLTENAQQILRDEMRKRGIAEERTTKEPVAHDEQSNSAFVHWDTGEDAIDDAPQDSGIDYTWKTALYRCDSIDEAAERCEMLRRAGIESWVQRQGSRFIVPWVDELGTGALQIVVAADQLDNARAIVTQPIPQDIVDERRELVEAAEYQPPLCPKCGAEDPTLESVEPSNSWLCESCGYEWSDPVSDPSASPQAAG